MTYIEPPSTQSQLRMHLFLVHALYVGDVKDMAGLRACHTQAHDSDFDLAYRIPHTHIPGGS